MEKYVLKKTKDGEITVRDVQLVLLEMAKDIDKICRDNNIPYWLNGGSALGAVRHQGFIPWDDDFDIAMMYPDYLRFIAALDKDLDQSKYLYHCFEKNDQYNVLIPAMKIRKRGTYIKEVNTLLRNKIKEKDGDGLFIDVFVYDHCSNNRFIDLPFRLVNMILMPIIIFIDNIGINPVGLKRFFVHNARLYGRLNKRSSYIGFDLCWQFKTPFDPFIFLKSDIFPTQYVKFEDTEFPIAHNPHRFLCTAIAPSYMVIPDEKHRFAKHTVDVKL